MPRDPRSAITTSARVMMSFMRSLRPKGRLLPARTTTFVVCAAICLSTRGSVAHAEDSPAPAEPAVPAPAPPAMPMALGSWCTSLFPMSVKKQRNRARALMVGKVNLDKGGTYSLTENPDWRPQSSADLSGNRHINSLRWALPLLFRGVNTQNQAMVDRFKQLMYDWIDDHQGKVDTKGRRTTPENICLTPGTAWGTQNGPVWLATS